MPETKIEQQTVYGSIEERQKKIEELKKGGWKIVRTMGYYVPFGIDMVADGTLMEREISN